MSNAEEPFINLASHKATSETKQRVISCDMVKTKDLLRTCVLKETRYEAISPEWFPSAIKHNN